MPLTNRHQLSPNQKRSGVFISYARSDGSEFANQLRQLLERQNIPLWQDRIAMEGGKDWWQQIKEALDKVSFLLLIVTPNALKSNIVRDEWRYARQQGVCVYPIKGSPDIDYNSMPRWMRDAAFYDLGTLANGDFSHEWPKLLNDLHKTPEVRRVPFMVEDLPANHVHRSEKFDQLMALLLDRTNEEPIAITAALRGAGGYGKTTIAKSLCHNEQVQDAFDDGILWVTLGETPGDLTGRVEDLIQTISGERPGFSNLEAAITRFTELLADRDILLVIDDVWNRDHLRPFLQGGKRCARLITTRNLNTLPPQTKPVKVDAMQSAEAVQTLRAGLPAANQEDCENELRKLADRLGEWPLLLGLVGSALQDRVVNTNQPLAEAIDYVNRALDKRGLTFFDAQNPEARNQAVAKTLGVSLELLRLPERARYNELAVFPKDVNIPLATLEKYWSSTGSFDEFGTEALCTRLNQLSLLHTFDAKARHIRLHDVVRQYLMHEQRDRLASLHNQLLDAHRPDFPSDNSPVSVWSDLSDDDPYFWDHLAVHLIEAGCEQQLVATVKDWKYLAKKTLLKKSLLVEQDLLKAEKITSPQDPLNTLRRNFVNTGHIFNNCQTLKEMAATFFVRFQHLDGMTEGLQDIRQNLTPIYITLRSGLPDLPAPALLRTLEGHSDWVNGCAFSPDGKQIVSASIDRTLKVWDANSGKMLRTLKGHSDWVNGCAFSPDGRQIVSASNDYLLKVWDANSGEMLRTLKGHSDWVIDCAYSPDGKQIVSASNDCTLKIWDAQSGKIFRTLKGHLARVKGCTYSPDGKQIVSASSDCTLKVWDAQSGEMLHTLKGHLAKITSCAYSPDSMQIVSASHDHTLKVWDANSGEMLRTLKGHSAWVNGCAFRTDGKQIVSASNDRALKVWDVPSGEILHTLEGHSARINGCAFSPDGKQIVSASNDRMLKIWDANNGEMLRTLKGHSDWITDCTYSPDGGQIISASNYCELKAWDANSGEMLRTFKGHSARVNGCAYSPGGKQIVSASNDCTLKVWDANSGEILRTFKGHLERVNGCAYSPDGKQIVSASDDRTLKVWDALSGEILHTLKGHLERVNDCAFSPDGKQIVSASSDYTLKVWDALNGEILYTLKGHSERVNCCAFSPDGKQIISAANDRMLKVWDTNSGEMLHTLKGHSAWITDCIYSLDGKQLVSASDDGRLKIWDAETDECLATFYADGSLACCTVSGDLIVAGGTRGIYFLRLVQ